MKYMKSTMKTTKHILFAAIAAASGFTYAQQDHQTDIFVNAGKVYFSDIDLDDSAIWGVNVGFVLNPNWTLEAAISRFDTEVEGTSFDIEGTQYRLDALYHFDTSSAWRPFVAFGVGDETLDADGFDDNDTMLNIGVGLKRDLGDRWQFRTDLRNFNSLDDEYNELALTVGLGYRFGTAAPAPVATPAPEPVRDVDSDGDGVYDSKDQCPNTPRTHKVDAVGCSLKLTETVSIELNITFDTAKAVIKPEFENEVAKLAEFMDQYADTVVTVEGHTDSQGSDVYNQKLSQERADAVKALLISRYNISEERVNAAGYGESKPVADNSSADGREQNRRVVGAVSSAVTKTITK